MPGDRFEFGFFGGLERPAVFPGVLDGGNDPEVAVGVARPALVLSRGAAHWIQGADEAANSIGLKPLMSGLRTEDEGLFVVQHEYWQEALQRALSAEATPTA